MQVSVSSYGSVEITDEVTIEADLEDVLNECSTDQLLEALNYQGVDWVATMVNGGDVDAILEEIGTDAIEDYMVRHGGFTLESVPVDDLIGALEAANALPGVKVPADVAQAFKIASDFINGSYLDIHNGQLAGKRFIVE